MNEKLGNETAEKVIIRGGTGYLVEDETDWVFYDSSDEEHSRFNKFVYIQRPISFVEKAGWEVVDKNRYAEIVKDYRDFLKYRNIPDAPEHIKKLRAERERWTKGDEKNNE